jgi:SAM-dependent methyltransferase
MDMYELLYDISKRPEPFSRHTVKELWTRPHLAQQMLTYHLSQETDLASRRYEAIDRVVEWIDAQLALSNKSLCDLGCGPGLYAQRFESRGAKVTGVDFSTHSLDFAKSQGRQTVRYIEADYLVDDLPTGFVNGNIKLTPIGSFTPKEEVTIIEHNLMGGFWSAEDYVGLQRTFVYPDELLTLDRYLIVEPNETWQIYNWTQHFTPQSIEIELKSAGFQIDQIAGDLSGTPLEPGNDLIGIIASVG